MRMRWESFKQNRVKQSQHWERLHTLHVPIQVGIPISATYLQISAQGYKTFNLHQNVTIQQAFVGFLYPWNPKKWQCQSKRHQEKRFFHKGQDKSMYFYLRKTYLSLVQKHPLLKIFWLKQLPIKDILLKQEKPTALKSGILWLKQVYLQLLSFFRSFAFCKRRLPFSTPYLQTDRL